MKDHLVIFLGCMVKDIIDGSKIFPNITNNRLRNIVKNQVTLTLQEKKVTALKKNSEFGLIAKHLDPVISQEDFSEAVLKKEIDEAYSTPATVSYKEIEKKFASKLTEAKSNLDNIHKIGNSLTEKYNILLNKYQQNPPGVMSYKDYSLSYEEWKDVSCLGPEDTVINELNRYLNAKNPDDITVTVFLNYISKLQNDLVLKTQELKSMILPEEKKESIKNEISTSSGLPIRQSMLMLEVVLSKTGMQSLINQMDAHRGLTADFYIRITDLLSHINKFQNGFDRKMNKSDNRDLLIENETVKFNIGFLNEIKKGLVYLKCYYRYVQWNKYVILPTGKINTDLLDKATSNGITKDDLRLFVSNTDFKINTNFSIQNILDKKELYLNMQKRAEEKARINTIENEKSAKKLALQTVINDYFKSKEIPNSMEKSLAFATETVGLNHAVEYGIYKAVLNTEQADQFTKDMFNNMSTEFAKLMEQAVEVDSKMAMEVQVSVVAKMVSSFIISNYC